jgi:hypothetical protein
LELCYLAIHLLPQLRVIDFLGKGGDLNSDRQERCIIP